MGSREEIIYTAKVEIMKSRKNIIINFRMLRLGNSVTKVRTLSQTRPLEKNKFGKKGRKGRTSVMGGKYDQDHWPNVMRGTVCSIIIF